VAVDVGPFQERVLLDQPVELVPGQEVVLAAVDLARAGRPRRAGNGQDEIGNQLQDPLDDRPLADPRGAGDDEESA
jgi:hypothetical protein